MENQITKILGTSLHSKISKLYEENDSAILKTFGVYAHNNNIVIIISDDIENSKKYFEKDLSENLWLCDSQEYIECDKCHLIFSIEETSVVDGEIFCESCLLKEE